MNYLVKYRCTKTTKKIHKKSTFLNIEFHGSQQRTGKHRCKQGLIMSELLMKKINLPPCFIHWIWLSGGEMREGAGTPHLRADLFWSLGFYNMLETKIIWWCILHMFIIIHFYICKSTCPNAVGVKVWASISALKCIESNMKENIKLLTISVGY